MSVTVNATIDVATPEVRDALRAVIPLANKLITDDHEAEHRVRLIFGDAKPESVDDGGTPRPGYLLLVASNGQATGLAKVGIVHDSRQLGLTSDDGPIVVDISPRRARLLLQQFKSKASDPDVGQLMRFEISPEHIGVSDVGGLWSDGERCYYPIEEPAESFPDVVGVTGRALAGASGKSAVAKPLVTDGKLLAAFGPASRVYGQPLQLEGTGGAESRGWVVSCGPDFLGTLSSGHNDDDSLKRRDSAKRAWLELLPAKRLAAVGG